MVVVSLKRGQQGEADAVSLVNGFKIGGVGHEGQTVLGAVTLHLLPGAAKQRTDEALPCGRDAGQPVDPAAAKEVEQHALGLVAGGVRRGGHGALVLCGGPFKKGIARLAAGLFLADAPLLGERRNVDLLLEQRHAQTVAQARDKGGVVKGGLSAQQVVEMGGRDLAAVRRLQGQQRVQQADRIGPARERHHDVAGLRRQVCLEHALHLPQQGVSSRHDASPAT